MAGRMYIGTTMNCYILNIETKGLKVLENVFKNVSSV